VTIPEAMEALEQISHVHASSDTVKVEERSLPAGCKRCGAPKRPFQVYCGAACAAEAGA